MGEIRLTSKGNWSANRDMRLAQLEQVTQTEALVSRLGAIAREHAKNEARAERRELPRAQRLAAWLRAEPIESGPTIWRRVTVATAAGRTVASYELTGGGTSLRVDAWNSATLWTLMGNVPRSSDQTAHYRGSLSGQGVADVDEALAMLDDSRGLVVTAQRASFGEY